MRTKPRLLLLDAGAVFAALRFEAWGEHQFTAEFAQRHLEEGKIRRIQGRGLAD